MRSNILLTTCGFTLLLAALLLCGGGQLIAQPKKAAPAKQAAANYTSKIIESPNHTYGYDIYANGKLLVHQPTIPAVAGNNGFASKAAAEAVAGLVIKKIQKGEMPPTVTVDEMRQLKAVP